VRDAGYTKPTDIQTRAIPTALEGRDVVGCAATGTGKTAAFVLPMLQRLNATTTDKRPHVRGLIVTSTRELASQVHEVLRDSSRHLRMRSVVIYGGVGMGAQETALRRGVDVIVATPGRLLDHMERGNIDLSAVEILVLDEADRMLDMGFIRDIKRILRAVPKERQTMLFSATMSDDIRTLIISILRNPFLVEIGERRKPVASVSQSAYSVSREMKSDLLLRLIQSERMESVLVFSRTKRGADKIARRLEQDGIRVAAIHSNRSQSQREHALAGFRARRVRVLVATDIASRGIDVEGISHVFNFDLPNSSDDYIHRIGRTGRASALGAAVTFVTRDEEADFRRIERTIGARIERREHPPAYAR
jgi:ATP-dependent RNA helicase RhlE